MLEKRTSASNLFARKCMVTALMQIMKEKPFSSITITEITQRAGVSRMTYYRNYSSKEEIFKGYLDDILCEYYSESPDNKTRGAFYDFENLLHCFNFIESHMDFVNSLFLGGLGNMLLEGFGRYMTSKWYTGDDIEQYYELESFAGALYNVFIAWAQRGKRENPEQMAAIMHNIYIKRRS